ncbi:MAG: hypothetical protein GX777_02865 [Fastidiosipila sp.]|nr:hypothetical protein [Fastidiosipila sp.]
MKKDKHINIFKKEDGAGLVLALMVLMVLAVLGVAVAGVTIGSHKLGDISRDSNSAYYIAEAGANLAYEEMKNGVMPAYETSSNDETIYFNNIAGMIADFNPTVYAEKSFETQFGDQPKATITISDPKEKDDGKLYTITSIGEVDGKSRKVEKEFLVKFVPTTSGGGGGEWDLPSVPEGAALIVNGQLIMNSQGLIEGDVYSAWKSSSSITMWGDSKIDGDIYSAHSHLKEGIFTNPSNVGEHKYGKLNFLDSGDLWSEFASLPATMIQKPLDWKSYPGLPNITLNSKSESIKLSNNVYIKTISMSGESSLEIDTSNKDINIVVDDLSIWGTGKLSFIGDGKINLYINNSYGNSTTSSINANGDASKLNFYFFGSGLQLNNKTLLNGNLFVEKGSLALNTNATVTGLVVSGGTSFVAYNKAVLKSPMIIIPNGEIHLTSVAPIEGVIVAKSITLDGSSSSSPVAGTPGASGSSGSGSAPTFADLISAGPALEP